MSNISFNIPPAMPTQEGPHGIRYDFNHGARVYLPEGDWHVELYDDDNDNILFAADIKEGMVTSAKKYFVRFRIKVWIRGENTPVLDHTLRLEGENVLISFPVGTLGDLIGWFPYAERFRQQHRGKIFCTMAQPIIDLFRESYPGLILSTPAEYDEATGSHPAYATYRIGLFLRAMMSISPLTSVIRVFTGPQAIFSGWMRKRSCLNSYSTRRG